MRVGFSVNGTPGCGAGYAQPISPAGGLFTEAAPHVNDINAE
jgi:hypothetical protein